MYVLIVLHGCGCDNSQIKSSLKNVTNVCLFKFIFVIIATIRMNAVSPIAHTPRIRHLVVVMGLLTCG